MSQSKNILREPAEIRHAKELAALEASDEGDRPEGWRLSPRAVRTFVCGSDDRKVGPSGKGAGKKAAKISIERKFFGDDALVERAIVSLAGNRGLLLIGEPGTAKSLLSELFSAAISGTSGLVIQGTAATSEEQVGYSWNYALLLAEGPSTRALVPSPVYSAMAQGRIVRFEEITRCPPEVQDCLVSILSEKMLAIPELDADSSSLFARKGFNVIATANLRDRGVHEMSSALKRRFNFETVRPIGDLDLEVELVAREGERLLEESSARVELDRDIVKVLVTIFHELREGVTEDGVHIEKPSTVLSTAEAVSVALAAGLDAHYYGKGRLRPAELVRHLAGSVFKDDEEDLAKLRHYFRAVIRERAKKGGPWAEYYKARKWLPR